jgi:putative flippase GtrA
MLRNSRRWILMNAIIRKLEPRFIKFLFVVGINTLFGYGMFALFIYFHFHYSIASLLATMLGVLFNFKTTGKLVFKSNNNRLIFRFIGVYVIVYLMNILFLKILQLFEINVYFSGAILIFPLAILSYFLNSRYVFSSRRAEKIDD